VFFTASEFFSVLFLSANNANAGQVLFATQPACALLHVDSSKPDTQTSSSPLSQPQTAIICDTRFAERLHHRALSAHCRQRRPRTHRSLYICVWGGLVREVCGKDVDSQACTLGFHSQPTVQNLQNPPTPTDDPTALCVKRAERRGRCDRHRGGHRPVRQVCVLRPGRG
jgi:hypothetical protein